MVSSSLRFDARHWYPPTFKFLNVSHVMWWKSYLEGTAAQTHLDSLRCPHSDSASSPVGQTDRLLKPKGHTACLFPHGELNKPSLRVKAQISASWLWTCVMDTSESQSQVWHKHKAKFITLCTMMKQRLVLRITRLTLTLRLNRTHSRVDRAWSHLWSCWFDLNEGPAGPSFLWLVSTDLFS